MKPNVTFSLGGLLLAACVPAAMETPPVETASSQPAETERAQEEALDARLRGESLCKADAVSGSIGKTWLASMEERLLAESGTRILRVIRPGQPISLDYRSDRLNAELDATGTIRRIYCG